MHTHKPVTYKCNLLSIIHHITAKSILQKYILQCFNVGGDRKKLDI